jgi:anti-sigma B factor antagonist
MANLSLEVRSQGPSCVVIAVAGEIDMETAPELAECLSEHTDVDVILDLSRVGFLSSSGVSVLVHAYKALPEGGHTLRTTGEQDNVGMVIEACGLDGYFHTDNPPARE